MRCVSLHFSPDWMTGNALAARLNSELALDWLKSREGRELRVEAE